MALIVLVVCIGFLAALAIRAAGRKRALIIAVSLIALGAWLWASETVIWRDDEYRQVIAEFKQATPFVRQADLGGGQSGWNENLVAPNDIRVSVRAGAHIDTATVRYSDEDAPREMFRPVDYTNISDVRSQGNLLYVLRSITLFRTEYRLTVFDINRRVVIADRRVDVGEVK